MKRISILIVTLCFSLFVKGQDTETKARATYLVAEEAYNNGDFKKAYDKLAETEKYLGKTNPKIEYLKVKSLMELKDFPKAQQALKKYFEIAKDKESEKYNEMLRLLGTIDEAIELNKTSIEFKENTAYLIRAIDSMVKKSYWFMQDEKKIKKSRFVSVTLDYKNATVKTLYVGDAYKNDVGQEYKLDASMRDINKVYYSDSGNGKTFEISIKYNSPVGTKKVIEESLLKYKEKIVPDYDKKVFFSITDEETSRRIVLCLTVLKELFSNYKGEMPN